MKQQNKPFVILQIEEINMNISPGEKVVYMTIKSFCGNGTLEVPLSTREIAQRCSLSNIYISKIIPLLIKENLLKIVGKKTRVGGAVNVFKVLTPVNSKCEPEITLKPQESVNPGKESVNYSQTSVNNSGTKVPQSNKGIKEVPTTKKIITKYGEEYQPLN